MRKSAKICENLRKDCENLQKFVKIGDGLRRKEGYQVNRISGCRISEIRISGNL